MLSLEEAYQLLADLPIHGRVESTSLIDSLGLILAKPVAAQSDQPPFDRTTMDGFAVKLSGDLYEFLVVGTVLAGEEFDGVLRPGQAVRIMTGAPCPKDTTVVPVERTRMIESEDGNERVEIEPEALIPGKNIAWQGQDAKQGQVVLPAGIRLAPQTISSAAMAGATELPCFVPPRIGIVTTGDEIGSEGPAAVRNSNGPLLVALCRSLSLPTQAWHALDEPTQLEETLALAASESDIVVTVGGVSMGTADFVPGTAQRLGFEQILHRVAIQPGKPVFVARHSDGTCFLGLPGNPVSVLVTAHLFLARLVGHFCGDWAPKWSMVPLTQDYEHRGKRRLFLPAQRSEKGVHAVKWNGSGDFFSAARGDGLIDLAPQSIWKEGDLVNFLPYFGHFARETGQ